MRNLSHQHPWRQAGVISLSVFLGCSLLSVVAGASSGLADSPLASAASQLDGTWTATFTVYSSTIPIAQPGQQLTGLTFTVEGSQISGDISGTIDLKTQTLPTLSGQLYVAQVTSSAIGQGVSCQGEIYFTSQGSSYVGAEYEDSIKCNGGQITGSIDGYRVSGSSTGTSSTTTTTPTPTCGVPTAPFPATGDFVTVTVINTGDQSSSTEHPSRWRASASCRCQRPVLRLCTRRPATHLRHAESTDKCVGTLDRSRQ